MAWPPTVCQWPFNPTLPHPARAARPVSIPHPEEGRRPVSKEGPLDSGVCGRSFETALTRFLRMRPSWWQGRIAVGRRSAQRAVEPGHGQRIFAQGLVIRRVRQQRSRKKPRTSAARSLPVISSGRSTQGFSSWGAPRPIQYISPHPEELRSSVSKDGPLAR